MAKILNERGASIAALSAFIALASALSGCGPITASLVPSDVRATVAADARASGPKVTADDILANALGTDKGGESIVAKTSPTASTPDTDLSAQTIIAKTSTIDTRTTASVSTHAKTSNAALANAWVESPSNDLEDLPIAPQGQAQPLGVDDLPLDAPFSDIAGDDASETQSANELFSSYQERTESNGDYQGQNNEDQNDDYTLISSNASPTPPHEQDAQAIFNAARAAQSNGLLAQTNSLASISPPHTNTDAQAVDPNELLVRARTLLAAQGQQQKDAPRKTLLQFSASQKKLDPSQYSKVGAFIKQHPDRPIILSAAPGSTGTAYEKLATAQQRLAHLSHLAPQFAKATRKIAPNLSPDTIEIKVGHTDGS